MEGSIGFVQVERGEADSRRRGLGRSVHSTNGDSVVPSTMMG